MTQNGKIFITKNNILNLLVKQQFSIGLSLYIIKEIEQELQKIYNDIISKELQENQEKIQSTINSIEQEQQIDMTDTGLTITSFEDNDQDQVD